MSTVDYAVTDPAQDGRFVAFTRECEALISAANGHAQVVAFLNTLDLDGTRALRSYAVKADATTLIELIDTTWAAR